MSLTIRPAGQEDRARILEISSRIWEGDDYVHLVLDEWIADPTGEVVVACWQDRPIAFSFRNMYVPGVSWLQGIRTDPDCRGRGAGRAITEHFIEASRRDGARRIGLSTYIDNEASIHIIESYGFVRVAEYVYLETTDKTDFADSEASVDSISDDEARAFVEASASSRASAGNIPWIWKMFSIEEAWPAIAERVPYWRGVRRSQRLESLVGISPGDDQEDAAFVSFLEGRTEDLVGLLRRAQMDLRPPRFEFMIPNDGTTEAPVLDLLRASGCTSWSDFKPDVFHYELQLDG